MIVKEVERPTLSGLRLVRTITPQETGAAGINRRVREARIADGMTQAALARESGVALQTIKDIERRMRRMPPSVDTLAKLARATGVTMDWLYWGDE